MKKITPPYYAVIFSSQLSGEDTENYASTNEHLYGIVKDFEGFLGYDSIRTAEGKGLAVLYWESREAIENWSRHTEHVEAKKEGRRTWYRSYDLKICKVEEERLFSR